MDSFTPEMRSRIMSSVGTRNTAPERAVRSLLHSMGLRFRLHRKGLPGTPDVVLPMHRLIIFIHGCFWHRHQGCARATTPQTNVAFWVAKFEHNVARDKANRLALKRLGWRVIVVWECELRNPERLQARLRRLILEVPRVTQDAP